MRVALIGPVGSGKSTQAQRLSWTMPFYNRCPRLSTGDLVQAQIRDPDAHRDADRGLLQGGRARPRRDSHGHACASRADGRGFALDGFPANAAQAEVPDVELEGPARALCTT
jgi:adenylate kinase family enzyme